VALDASQKAKIRRYLGYPDVANEPYWLLEDHLNGLSAEGEVEVESILASLAALDAQRVTNVAYANLKRAEEVEFYEGGGALLMQERARLIAELAGILGVPVNTTTAASGGGACLRG
jgi:hypothetical protein